MSALTFWDLGLGSARTSDLGLGLWLFNDTKIVLTNVLFIIYYSCSNLFFTKKSVACNGQFKSIPRVPSPL